MNNISIIGRMGHDVSLRYTTDETAVGRFSVAVGRGKDKDGNDLGTDWFECVSFGRQAETIHRFFHKGDYIGITGKVRIGKYTDKEGVDRKSFDINVIQFDFVGGKKQEEPKEEQVAGFTTMDNEPPF